VRDSVGENHATDVAADRSARFFDETEIPDRLYYISAFYLLDENGLSAVLDLLRREIQRHNAGVVILDGFSVIEETAGSVRDFKSSSTNCRPRRPSPTARSFS
jgi:circadian clock protein KaiC